MSLITELKGKLFYLLEKTNTGEKLVFYVKKKLGKLPDIDLDFPGSIHLEITSLCNLSCIHCPSHLPSLNKMAKSHGLMSQEIFNKAMDEIDSYGPVRLALHKDGEPLLHPEILDILSRVKRKQPHYVTVITNAHLLSPEIADAILIHHIDNVIFSIGAASRSFYQKVRGDGFEHVIENILRFLEKRDNLHSATTVTVQIINLPEFPEMKKEIRQFKKYWRVKGVNVMVFDKLNWGVFKAQKPKIKRYPCPSLWRNLFVHWDARVSPCCMDWTQSLPVGNLNQQSLAEIWCSDQIKNYREAHLKHEFAGLPLCEKCNYWSTITRLEVK